MLRACPHCGRVHDSGCPCAESKRYRRAGKTGARREDRFRWSYAWKRKTEQVKERDYWLCQSCLRGLGQRGKRITAESLEVHHIEGLASAWRKRLDSGNLITLCADCHGEAERGDIAKGILSDIAAANERECGAKAEEIPPAFVI